MCDLVSRRADLYHNVGLTECPDPDRWYQSGRGGRPLGAGQDDRTTDADTGKAAARGKRDDRDVGAALRSVYQKTVEEHVPDEFLDLLGKLG